MSATKSLSLGWQLRVPVQYMSHSLFHCIFLRVTKRLQVAIAFQQHV
ncbi:unnamed protein product [Brugia timori]|uniref:Uncharacterized protein n=1 Tax=Brugia timori TaxID=42155 RepID=A0A0R3QFH3_9BILA|nr:unnamed protein product [Brugia timori]